MNKVLNFLIGKGSAIAYALITAIFTIIPEDCFKIIKFNANWSDTANVLIIRLIVCATVFIVTNVGYKIYKKKRKKVSISGKNYSIEIEYGDLLSITDGKVVINFDECFTTKVGEEPADIKPASVCGQYLEKHPISNMQGLIDKADIKPARGKSQFKGMDRYAPGTIVPNGDYLLMAFAKLDANGLGHLTYGEYLDCLNTLWAQIDLRHGTSDVYLPILGSKITRFDKDLSQQELLDTMISSYRLSPQKMKKPCKLHIVCKERDGFSLNDVFGVE